MAAITAILARYPEEVITTVTHPATGLPSKKGWLPTVKEVSDACADAMEPIVENEMRLKRIKEQMEMREREAKGERPTLHQLQEKYGKTYGIGQERPEKTLEERWSEYKAPSKAELAAHYSQYGLEFIPRDRTNPEQTVRSMGETGE